MGLVCAQETKARTGRIRRFIKQVPAHTIREKKLIDIGFHLDFTGIGMLFRTVCSGHWTN